MPNFTDPDGLLKGAPLVDVARAMGAGATSGTGPRRDRISASEAGLAKKAALTPDEQAADIADRQSDSNFAQLESAIRGEKDPKARAILEQERVTLAAERQNAPAQAAAMPGASTDSPAPVKWSAVTANPEWAKLGDDEREALRNHYFHTVILPTLEPDQVRSVRASFDEATKPSLTKTVTGAIKASGVLDAVGAAARGTANWAKNAVMPKGSVMDGPLPDLASQPGALAPMSRQGTNTAAAVAAGIGTQGVDKLRAEPGVIPRAVVQAADDPARQANAAAVDSAIAPVPEAPAPIRTPTQRYAEYKKNYPMLGPDEIWASVRHDTRLGVDRSSPVALSAPGAQQFNLQDWAARQMSQAQSDAGSYVAPALARGAAQLGGGLTEFVTGLLPSTFNRFVVNPVLTAAGSKFQFPDVTGIGAEPFERTAYRNPQSKTAAKSWDALKGSGEVADWLGEHMAEQAPQLAAMFTTALAPRALSNLFLLGMGAMSAGGQYRQNILAHPEEASKSMTEAWTEGGIEVLSEMLPLGVFHKIQDKIHGMSFADKAGFVGRMLRAAGVGVAALGAHAGTESIEEIVAQITQNLSKKYMLGEKVDWKDGVKEAGIIGAISGAPLSIPHTVAATAKALAPQNDSPATTAALGGIPGSVGDVLSGDAATPGAPPPGGGPAPLALPAPGMTTPPDGQLASNALAQLRDFIDSIRDEPMPQGGDNATILDTLVQRARSVGVPQAEIDIAITAKSPEHEAAIRDAKRLAAEATREAGMAEIARQGAMQNEIAQGLRALPAPETPTGRNGFVNDGEFTRPETFEDQQNRLDSLARIAVQREEAAKRAALGLTPDIERAQQRRALREAGIDPISAPEQAAPAQTNSVVAIAGVAPPRPDITRADGQPFKTEAAAARARKAKKVPRSWKLTPVDGGFVWRAPQPRAPKATPADNADTFKAMAKHRLVSMIDKAGGLNVDESADYTGDRNRFLANQRLPGVFRHGGMSIDTFGALLRESGYITDAEHADQDGAAYARQIIADAMAGDFVGTPDEKNEYYGRLQAEHADAEIAASGFEQLPEVDQTEVADYDDSGEWDTVDAEISGSTVTLEEGMRALGFTEQEIQDAVRQGQGAGSAAGVSGVARQAGQDEPSSPQGRGPPDSGPNPESAGNGRRPPGNPEGETGVAAEPPPKPKTPPQGGVSASGPLYASRPVLNADAIIAWAKSQGFKSTLPAADMHVTVAYSKAPLDGAKVGNAKPGVVLLGGKRSVEALGDEGAVVLKLSSKDLHARWQQYRDAGASWDYEGYQPHITITYDGKGVDLSKVEPYRGAIKLGAEKQEPLNVDKADEHVEKPTAAPEAAAPAKQHDMSREGAQIAALNTLRDRFKRGDNMDEFKGGESSNRTGGFTVAVQTSRAKHGEVTATGYQADYTFKLKDLVAILKAEASAPAEKQEAPALELSGQTQEQGIAAAKAAEDAAKAEAKKLADKEKAERDARVKKEIADRSHAAAGDFQLGQTQAEAEASLAGQGDIFGQSDAKPIDPADTKTTTVETKAPAVETKTEPTEPEPAKSEAPKAEPQDPTETLKRLGFNENGPGPGEWVLAVSKLGDVIAKPVGNDRFEVSADYMGKRFATETVSGAAELSAMVGDFTAKINEGREKLAQQAVADKRGLPRPQPAEPTKGKITDSGEELKANRRNQPPGGLKWSDVADLNETRRVAEVVKEKVWPRPDYAAMVEDGAHPFAAHVVKQVYDKIAAAPDVKGVPSDADLQRYIAVVNRVRATMEAWAADKGAQARMVAAIAGVGRAATSYGTQIEISKLMDAGERPLLDQVFPGTERGRFRGDTDAAKDARIAGGNPLIHALQPGFEEAKRALKALGEGWPSKQEAWKKQGFQVVRRDDVARVSDGKRYDKDGQGTPVFTASIGKGWGSGSLSTHDTHAEAQAAIDALKPWLTLDKRNKVVGQYDSEGAALEGVRDQVKRARQVDEPDAKPLELAERVGAERRAPDENITSGRLAGTFGFRGVNFGNWMPQDERQAHLNHAYDALLDLAELLNVPAKALSLDGKLGVAFGAQGKGSAAAHFVPGLNEINLTRTSGVGALAHEWAHAVDHYFGTQDGARVARAERPYLSAIAAPGFKAEGVRQEIADAFAGLVKAMRKTIETRAAFEARIQKQEATALRNLNGWLTQVRQGVAGNADALTKFDALADKLRAGDLGEGHVSIPGRDRALRPTAAALRDLVKAETGRVPNIDAIQAIDSWAHSVSLHKDREKFFAEHQPQEVRTEFDKASAVRDLKKAKPYWQTPWEMFARAFETYVIDRLARDNARNDYLSDADRWARHEEAGLLEGPNPYPKGAEREAINAAFDRLVGELKTRSTDTGGVALFARRTPGVGDSKLSAAVTLLAEHDDLFQQPTTHDKDITAIAAAIDPGYSVEKLPPSSARLKDAKEAWRVNVPGKQRGGEIYASEGFVWINVSRLIAWQDGGAKIYGIAAAYAHNNGKVMMGDPDGLSRAAYYRRTENMLSSALKFGTTDHLEPHEGQTNAKVYFQHKPEFADKTRDMEWRQGDTPHNLRELLYTSYVNTTRQVPDIKNVSYDFANRRFVESPGRSDAGGIAGDEQPFTQKSFDDLAKRTRALAGPGAPGSATLKRAALIGTLLRGQRGEGRRVILDEIGRQLRGRLDPALKGTFYKQSEAPPSEGLSVSEVRSHVDSLMSGWSNALPTHVLASPAHANFTDGKGNPITVPADADAALYNGQVWLFASNLKTPAQIEFALFHENFGHAGLRGTLGRGLDAELRRISNLNAGVRKAAAAWTASFGRDALAAAVKRGESAAEARRSVELLAIEEALSDMAGQGKPITGLQRFMAKVQELLRAIGLTHVADWLESATDAEVAALLSRARKWVEGETHVSSPEELAATFSRRAVEAATGSDALAPAVEAVEAEIPKAAKSRARRAIERMDALFEPLGRLPDKNAYLVERYKTLGRIARVDEIAGSIGKVFKRASEEDRAAAYEYLTTAGASPLTIKDEATRQQAITAKQLIGSVGDALVARGLLSEESREEYRDRYLPRLYLKHVLSESDYKAIGGGKKASDMGYLKARKDIPEDVRQVILGEITDPGFLAATGVAKPMRDMALLDWLAQISGNDSWVDKGSVAQWNGTPVSVRWLQLEAARLRKQADYYTPEIAAKALATAAEMEKLVDASTGGAAPDPKLYKQIPETARYGRLRGMWVRKEIYDDLMGVHDFMPTSPGIVQSLLGYGGIGTKATQLWKMSKVALNPPGQVRNFVSNAVMLQLSGVPLLRLADTMIRAGLQISGDGKHYQIAKKYGVTASTFSVQELGRIRTDLLALQARSRGFHPFARLRLVAGTIANAASDAYQFSETLFKTAKIMDAMDRQGMSEAEAAIEAHKWMFDYSLVSQGVRYARNAPIGVPFITYVYKVLPRLLEVALLHPWRALPWVGLMYGLGAAAASAFGVGDDDLEKLKKALPDWLQKRGSAAFLPYKDDMGRVQAIDLGYFFPWSQWQEFVAAIAHGEPGEAVQAAGLFSGPITDLIVAMKTGQNSFTKKPIWNEGDPTARQAADIANYVYDMAMPPFLGSHGVLSPMGLLDPQYGGKAVQAATGTSNKFGDPRATAEQAALALVGVNLYALDPDHTRVQNILKLKREEQDSEARLRQQLQDKGLNDERRQALVKEYYAEIDRRAKKLAQYISDSEVHPNLKAANH